MTSLLLSASIALLITAALHDAAFRTVPNFVSAGLALCGLALHATGGGLPGALLAASLVFAAAVFCWRRGWMGGADVKLLGAVCLLVPTAQVPALLTAIALAGGVLTLPFLAARQRLPAPAYAKPNSLPARIVRAERRRLRRGGPLPYAVAIAAGTCITLLQGVSS